MSKYLILDDGNKIKAYNSEQNKYITVGELPITKSMFENFGNNKIYNRNGLILENPTIYYLSDEIKNFKLKSLVLHEPQVIISKNTQAVKGIKSIEVKYDLTLDSYIKFAISFDNGKTFKTFKNNLWSDLNVSNINEFSQNGIDALAIESLMPSDFEKIQGDSNLLKLAFLLNKKSIDHKCRLKHLKIKYIV